MNSNIDQPKIVKRPLPVGLRNSVPEDTYIHASNADSPTESGTDPLPAFLATANAATLTENDGPLRRHRYVQTIRNVGVDAATQCNMLDEEIQFETGPEAEILNLSNGIFEYTPKMSEKKDFLTFVQEKTLCHICGNMYPNEVMLKSHDCMDKPGTGRRRHKCPHFKCNMVAISLMELYDHINIHMRKRRYKCVHCRCAFFSAVELRYHIRIHSKCRQNGASVKVYRYPNLHSRYDMAQRKCVTLHSDSTFSSPKTTHIVVRLHRRKKETSQLRQCTVCLKRVIVGALYSKHVKRCIKEHKKRIRESILKSDTAILNGHCV